MIRKLALPVLLVGICATLASCGLGGPQSPNSQSATTGPVSAAAGDVAADVTPEDATLELENGTTAPAPQATTEAASLEVLDPSLDNLESYRVRYTLTFESAAADGEIESGTMNMVQEYIKASNAQHISMNGSLLGDQSGAGVFELYTLDGVSYILTDNGGGTPQCISTASDEQMLDPSSMVFDPNDLIGSGLDDATSVKQGEIVNGVATSQYRFEESDGAIGTFSNIKGDLWVAQNGGYLVKYTGSATGKQQFTEGGVEGSFTWEYNVEEVNNLTSIDLPEACANQTPADDIPTPPSAINRAATGGFVTFESPDSVEQIVTFYQEEMPAQGWEAGDVSEFNSDFKMLVFRKDGRQLTINIAGGQGSNTSVTIMEE